MDGFDMDNSLDTFEAETDSFEVLDSETDVLASMDSVDIPELDDAAFDSVEAGGLDSGAADGFPPEFDEVDSAMDSAEAETLEFEEPEDRIEGALEPDPHEALSHMSEYMNAHNYGLEDYETYSRDPEWQALNRDLQLANGIETEEREPVEIPAETAETGEIPAETAETGEIPAETAEIGEIPAETAEPAEQRVFDEFEQTVLEEDPEFYDSGSFYQQGINEFGYQSTCGPTSQANAINELLGTNELTENRVLSVAVDNNLCQTFGDPEDCGGTTTEQFMELYDKMNEQLGDKFDTELYEYGNALDANQVAERLENGDVVNVAVDACGLWDMPRDYVDALGVRQDDFYSDHWITVTGVERMDDGEISGFNIIDSGGGENYVSLDKYNDICFGTDEHKVIDPTCIVLSKKDVPAEQGGISEVGTPEA